MILKLRTDCLQREIFYIAVHKYDRMRIAHGHAGHTVFFPVHKDRHIHRPVTFCFHRHFRRLQFRFSHINLNQFHLTVFHRQVKIFDAAQCFHGNVRLIRQAIIIDIFCHTADAVAAHLSAGAVRIVHLHLKIRLVRRIDHDQPI